MTDAELVAYNTGKRMATTGETTYSDVVHSGGIPQWAMTEEEIGAHDALGFDAWRRWWGRGWAEQMSEED